MGSLYNKKMAMKPLGGGDFSLATPPAQQQQQQTTSLADVTPFDAFLTEMSGLSNGFLYSLLRRRWIETGGW